MGHSVDSLFYKEADQFFSDNASTALTYDDVTLATRYSEVLPRQTSLDVALSEKLHLRIPVLSADMDTVTESRMAIAMALCGGLGLIHYNMTEKEQVKEVARVKNHIHGLIQDPIRVSPDSSIGQVIELCDERRFVFRTFPVVDESGALIGLLPGPVVKPRYASKKVAEAMTPRSQILTIAQSELGADPIKTADRFFNENMGIHKLLVVDDKDRLRGLFTLSDIERIMEEARADVKPARDDRFRLICGAAISATRTAGGELDSERILAHVSEMVEEGLDVVAVSTAHGFSRGVGQVVRLIRNAFKDLSILAGNVTSGEGVRFLAEAGANAVKVGQGPGSICTTRVVAGVGIPQLTALYICSKAGAESGVKVIADGGITKSGDAVKALTLADAVICGGMLAGCREAPGKIIEINGKVYKEYRGMGSLEAMKAGSAARYGHEKSDKNAKMAAEGIEALKEVSGPLEYVLRELVGGLQSGMGYLGAATLKDLRKNARYIRVSPAGVREAGAHDVMEVKTTKDSSE